MPVSRIDQSKGRWWDTEQVGDSCKAGCHDECRVLGCNCRCHAKERQPAKPAAVLRFRRLKEERCECGRKMIDKGGVWTYGEQRGRLWTPIRHFCKKCFDKQVREGVRKFIARMEAEDQAVVIRAYSNGDTLPAWINFEAQSLDELPVGTELPSGKRVGDEPAKEPEKKTICLFGQTVEVVGDYGGMALKKEKVNGRK